MKCIIITPIGPGHEELFQHCRRSVERAIAHSTGPFSTVLHGSIDDTRGALGRSAARNSEVVQGVASGADWVFFLDADDLLLDDAFEKVKDAVGDYDAVWGTICEQKKGSTTHEIRDKQDMPVRDVRDILRIDPFYSLQMGHFVRAQIAEQTPFDVHLNAGEDFDYYLRIWLKYRCVKLTVPLFVNRRGMHSQGPRCASGGAWRRQVKEVMRRFAQRHHIEIDEEGS
jgi:glycosyltransferase involved in cell wall biosynthesis